MDDSKPGRRQQGGRFGDARGRPVRLLDPYELHLRRRYDVIPADVLPGIAAGVGFGLPRWQRLGYLLCVALFLACVAFLVVWKLIRQVGLDAREWVLWPVNLAVFALGATQFWRSGRRARAERVRAVMLQHLRCPHCGYDLRGLPVDPADGATVCPECGCAWRLRDIQSTTEHCDG